VNEILEISFAGSPVRRLKSLHLALEDPDAPSIMLLRLDQVRLDASFGLRQLVRSPLVASVAVVTLAIGIGLNTAVFSLVNAVLLRPLPYPDSERLVWIAPRVGHSAGDRHLDAWTRWNYIVHREGAQPGVEVDIGQCVTAPSPRAC
jgi:hypothetical protein